MKVMIFGNPLKSVFSCSAFVLLIGLFALHLSASAATAPQFLVTWKAQSYVPQGFEGKVLPTAGSPVVVSFELLQDGRLMNISRETIYWYLGDQLIQSGTGIQSVALRAPQLIGRNTIDLRIQLPNYKSGGLAIKTVHIPFVPPEVHVMQQNNSAAGFFEGNNFTLKAIPYFFNVTSPSHLSFEWSANGKPVGVDENDDPDTFSGALSEAAPGITVNVGVVVKNPAKEFESAAKSITLTSQ